MVDQSSSIPLRRTAPLLLLVAVLGIPRGVPGQAPPPGEIPPPPPDSAHAPRGTWVSPVFTPAGTPPVLVHRAAAVRLLERLFPGHALELSLPDDERIRLSCEARLDRGDTTVRVWAYVTARGVVGNTAIERSSGDQETDLRMIRLVRALEFHPALHRWRPTAVWRPVTLRLRPERCTA